MHVAVNAYFWNRPETGSGQYTRQLVFQLNRLVSDLKITLIYPMTAGDRGPQEVPPGVDVKVVQIRPGHLSKVHFEQIAFAQACQVVGATIAHVPYWGSPLRSPVPVVVTVHDLTTLLVREYRRGLKSRLYNALVSASARGADHVITDSLASKADVSRHLKVPEPDTTTIYLAAGREYRPEPDLLIDMAIRQEYDLQDSFVLYLGGYEVHKNVTTLLLAYTYVAKALGGEVPLLLAGKPPGEATTRFPDYSSYIANLGLQQHIRWLGFIEEAHKPALYRAASSFAFVSRFEGFGLPPLEAMACGTPVVASNSSSLPEVLGDAGFTLDPDDARQIGGSIIATILQDELAAEMKQKGLEQAAKFTWEKTATETLLVYDSLAS